MTTIPIVNRLSRYFTLNELTHSATALRRGIDNSPGPMEYQNLVQVVENILEPVRRHFAIPFSPSSGYRSEVLNHLIGSKFTSQHIKGQAVDFEIPTIANDKVADWIRENLTFDQLILEYHVPGKPQSGWVHCSYNEGQNRNLCLIFDGHNYTDFNNINDGRG